MEFLNTSMDYFNLFTFGIYRHINIDIFSCLLSIMFHAYITKYVEFYLCRT